MVQSAKLRRNVAPSALLRVLPPHALMHAIATGTLALTIACVAAAAHAQPAAGNDTSEADGTATESYVTPSTSADVWAGIRPAEAAAETEAATDVPQGDEAIFDQPVDLTLPLTMPSGHTVDPSRFTHGLPTSPWSGKIGIDNRDVTPYPDPNSAMPTQNVGVAWAAIAAPGLMAWDKTAIETRVDPYEQTRFGVTLSRSMPIGSEVSLTLQNAFAWTQPLLQGAPIVAHGSHVVEGNHAVRFTFLPVDTTVSIGASSSTAESRWRPSLSAEQRLFGGPVSITGAVSETTAGEFDRSLKAGFKQRW